MFNIAVDDNNEEDFTPEQSVITVHSPIQYI